jgi:hypothetical protein
MGEMLALRPSMDNDVFPLCFLAIERTLLPTTRVAIPFGSRGGS